MTPSDPIIFFFNDSQNIKFQKLHDFNIFSDTKSDHYQKRSNWQAESTVTNIIFLQFNCLRIKYEVLKMDSIEQMQNEKENYS